MKKYMLLIAVLALVLTLGFIGCDKDENGEGVDDVIHQISVNGSTTVNPIMGTVAERYLDAELLISGTGSGDGITALIDGNADVAMSSRPMRPTEYDNARAKGMDVVEHLIANDGMAVVVHPSNQVSDLTMDQIKRIFLGEIKNWNEVGGNDAEIVVVTRESSSGTFASFSEIVMDKEPIVATAVQQKSNGDVRRTVAGAEGAIGFVGLGYVDNSLKALKVDGVTPAADTVNDGSYPIGRGLFLYAPKDAPAHVLAMIEWVKGPEGQAIAEEKGFVPLN